LEEPQIEQTQPEPPPPTRGEQVSLARTFGGRSLLREGVESILLILILILIVNVLTARFQVQGSCMEPTLEEDQYLIVSRAAYWLHPPARGDVIILHPPTNPDEDYVKRIIGLPGEEVEVRDGLTWIDGILLEEPYVATPADYEDSWTLHEDQYLVLGDNRNNADDSHTWGVLPLENIVGKAWLCYWPPEKWGTIAHSSEATLEE